MSTLAEQVVEQLKTDMDNVYDAGYQKMVEDFFEKNEVHFKIPSGITIVRPYMFHKKKFYEEVDFTQFEDINDHGFYLSDIPFHVSLQDNIKTFGNRAFFESNIPTLHINNSYITADTSGSNVQGRDLIRGNKSLSSVTFGKKTTCIPYGMVLGCYGIEKMYIPNTIKRIGSFAFERCINMREINFPASIEFVGEQICLGCTALEFVTIEQGFNANNLYLADSTLYSVETIVFWLEALADRTGLESYNLIIGTKNIEKLSEEQIAIATSKNWTLA